MKKLVLASCIILSSCVSKTKYENSERISENRRKTAETYLNLSMKYQHQYDSLLKVYKKSQGLSPEDDLMKMIEPLYYYFIQFKTKNTITEENHIVNFRIFKHRGLLTTDEEYKKMDECQSNYLETNSTEDVLDRSIQHFSSYSEASKTAEKQLHPGVTYNDIFNN